MRRVRLWGAQFKEVFTLRVMQVQGWHLTPLLALDGYYMKQGSVANKDGNISLHILSYCTIPPRLYLVKERVSSIYLSEKVEDKRDRMF